MNNINRAKDTLNAIRLNAHISHSDNKAKITLPNNEKMSAIHSIHTAVYRMKLIVLDITLFTFIRFCFFLCCKIIE